MLIFSISCICSLVNADLIKSRQVGLNKLYSVNQEDTREIIELLDEGVIAAGMIGFRLSQNAQIPQQTETVPVRWSSTLATALIWLFIWLMRTDGRG